jgi:hypothetical protein
MGRAAWVVVVLTQGTQHLSQTDPSRFSGKLRQANIVSLASGYKPRSAQ